MKQGSGTPARRRLAIFAGVVAVAAGAQAASAAPPVLESKGGLLVLPNVRVETAAQPVDAQAAAARGGASVRAYKDHETGQLRKATPEEQQQEAQSQGPSNDAAGARIVARGGARKSAALDDSFLSHSVVRRGPDGRLEVDCVSGETAAQHALHAKPVAKEARHAQ